MLRTDFSHKIKALNHWCSLTLGLTIGNHLMTLPLLPMAHQYLVTDDIPEIMDILKQGREFPHVMDPGGESYLRQEGRGLCEGDRILVKMKKADPWEETGRLEPAGYPQGPAGRAGGKRLWHGTAGRGRIRKT
mgnify:CR=1 FL=1